MIMKTYPNYSLMSSGKVYSRFRNRFLSGIDEAHGYKTVFLTNNEGKKKFYIHRLIAKAFVPNPEGHSFVNHIDGDKHNNKASNLEWCTQQENQLHAWKNGLNEGRKPVPINQLLAGEVIATYPSIMAAGEVTKINRGNISQALRGLVPHAGGYRWEYAR